MASSVQHERRDSLSEDDCMHEGAYQHNHDREDLLCVRIRGHVSKADGRQTRRREVQCSQVCGRDVRLIQDVVPQSGGQLPEPTCESQTKTGLMFSLTRTGYSMPRCLSRTRVTKKGADVLIAGSALLSSRQKADYSLTSQSTGLSSISSTAITNQMQAIQ